MTKCLYGEKGQIAHPNDEPEQLGKYNMGMNFYEMSLPDGEYVIWVNTPSAWIKTDDFNWENGGGVGITITSQKITKGSNSENNEKRVIFELPRCRPCTTIESEYPRSDGTEIINPNCVDWDTISAEQEKQDSLTSSSKRRRRLLQNTTSVNAINASSDNSTIATNNESTATPTNSNEGGQTTQGSGGKGELPFFGPSESESSGATVDCGDSRYCVNYACSKYTGSDFVDFSNVTATFTSNYVGFFSVDSYEGNPSPYPDPNTPRERWVGGSNRLVNGISIYQERVATEPCDGAAWEYFVGEKHHTFQEMSTACRGSKKSEEEYGVDPFLSSHSTLYNPDIGDKISSYYDTNNTALFNEFGVPYGFQHPPKGVDGFYIFFDINSDETWVKNILQYMKDGYFIDQNTKRITVYVQLYNADLHSFVLTQVKFKFQNNGLIKCETQTDIVNIGLYAKTQENEFRLYFEIFLCIFVALDFLGEIKQFYEMSIKYGCCSYFKQDLWNCKCSISVCRIISIYLTFFIHVCRLLAYH